MEKDGDKERQIVVKEPGIVMPAASVEDALAQYKVFSEMKDKLLLKSDKEKIKGNPYIRKTGWRKIKTFFNLSEEILSSERKVNKVEGKESIMWIYRVRVKAFNKDRTVRAFADSEMCCDTSETFSKGKAESAIMAMAQTRAFNRAISDLVGGGEVTAEEFTSENINSKVSNAKPVEETTEANCSECNKGVSQKVHDFSNENFGKVLCFECQKDEKAKTETPTETIT